MGTDSTIIMRDVAASGLAQVVKDGMQERRRKRRQVGRAAGIIISDQLINHSVVEGEDSGRIKGTFVENLLYTKNKTVKNNKKGLPGKKNEFIQIFENNNHT